MKQNFRNDYTDDWATVAQKVKDDAGWRCVRCGHANDRDSGHVLTVHHLDGDKLNNAWWNVAALCQRCHLRIQGRVVLARPWLLPHSEWFRPYVAGYYASVNGLSTERDYVMAHVDELLAIGQGVRE